MIVQLTLVNIQHMAMAFVTLIFLQALDKVPNGSFKVKVVDGIYDLETEKSKATIPSITSYYNFHFEDEGIRMWQAYGIGEGMST